MNILKKIKGWFKKPELIPFPIYPPIKINELENMSIILEVGSNKLTKWTMRKLYNWSYDKIFTHAFIQIENGQCINMGFTAYLQNINKLIKKDRYYLVINYRDTIGKMVRRGKKASYKIAGSKEYKYRIYDVRGFLYQGLKKIPVLNKIVHPSKRRNICSDLVADIYKYHMKHPLYKKVNDEETTPNDIYFPISLNYSESRFSRLLVE